ncbi:MAG: MarR family transcriptional regulator [Clostridia bacterium]|nr:MarR family transcriptional regulator [Clostridia bacterium]
MTREEAERFAARFEEALVQFFRRGGRTSWNFHEERLPHARLLLLTLLAARGPARVRELALALRVSAPAVTSLANELERAGYVVRRPDPEDGRATVLALTPSGEELVAEARARRHAHTVALLTHLEAREVEVFLRVLTRILELITERAAGERGAEAEPAGADGWRRRDDGSGQSRERTAIEA